jgi:Mg2+/Co2+ transporter CorC
LIMLNQLKSRKCLSSNVVSWKDSTVAGLFEIFVLLSLLLVTTSLSVAQTQLEVQEDVRAGTLSIARTLLFISAAVALLLSTPEQVWTIVVAAGIPAIWFAQQLSGRHLGRLRIGVTLARQLDGFVAVWAKLVAPLRLRPPEIVEEYEQELMDSVEEFSETLVREIMVPRVDIEVVDGHETLEKALSIFVSSGYSRLPVVGEDVDDIQGVLYLKDIARIVQQDPRLLETKIASEAARSAFFIPETKLVSELLQELQASRTQMAIISDEYGGVAGLVTIEDLIEELVGEITDEYDRETSGIDRLDDETYRVSPRITLDELAEQCEMELEDEDVDTIGGLLTKAIGHLPLGGEVVQVLGLELTAERVDARRGRILSIRVRKLPKDD